MDALLHHPSLPFLFGLLLGSLIHVNVFIHGEWHKSAPNVFISHVFFVAVLTIIGCLFQDGLTQRLVASTATTFAGYIVGLFASMTVYRVFLHSLTRHGFRGPWYARLTKLWHPWAARHARNHLLLEGFHEKYGDFVRTGKPTQRNHRAKVD